MAWWQSMPDPAKDDTTPAAKRKSRLQMQPETADIYLPPMDPDFAYLYDTLIEAGPTSTGPGGAIPLTWSDLMAWSAGTGIDLQPWEARTVRALSSAWVAETRRAEDREALAPWAEPMSEVARSAASVRAHMRALAQQAPKPRGRR